jgi:2-methylisocitrate lyase-like PEP mutase family enzyme
VYAPWLRDLGQVAAVVEAVGVPVNVLAVPNGPTIAELASVGVRRVSTGSLLARSAYGALVAGARELLADGTSSYAAGGLSADELKAAFDG